MSDCVWCLTQIWPSSFLLLLHRSFWSVFFPCSPLCLFLFSFLFLFPDWMNLCSVLFLPLCLSHNTPGQGWSILYITSATQCGTVTSTKSFSLCMVTWREWPMHAFVHALFLKHGFSFFFSNIHIQNKIQLAWDFSPSFFFHDFFCPNHLYEVLMFLLLSSSVGCDCCGCVRSVFALMEPQCLFTGVLWETHHLSQPAPRDFIQTIICLHRWTRV